MLVHTDESDLHAVRHNFCIPTFKQLVRCSMSNGWTYIGQRRVVAATWIVSILSGLCFLIYNVWNVFNQKSPGRLLNIGVSACPDVWTRDSHSPLRSSQYVCRGPKFGATLFVITANVRQIVPHAHSVQLPVLCNSVFNCYRSYFWHVP